HARLQANATEAALDRFDKVRNANGGTPTAVIRDRMQRTMQADAAVFRTGETLAEGVEKIREIRDSLADVHVSDRSLVWNPDEEGNTRIDYRPVHLYTLDDEVDMVPPKPRVY